jgi:hypothetical protein
MAVYKHRKVDSLGDPEPVFVCSLGSTGSYHPSAGSILHYVLYIQYMYVMHGSYLASCFETYPFCDMIRSVMCPYCDVSLYDEPLKNSPPFCN